MNTFFTIKGVGSLFLFHHMDITLSEAIMLMTIILSSLYIMICNELIVYQKDVNSTMERMNPTLLFLQASYTTAQKLRLFASRRTLILHYLVATIPSVLLVILFIYWEKLHFRHFGAIGIDH
ncbi:hypothetical protein ACFQ9Y_09575 [Peribacillus simplex]|uniref:hypothetical protein n=1 Tax=Peribacillus simplex TaxID=1478 RepID=UPI0036706FA5